MVNADELKIRVKIEGVCATCRFWGVWHAENEPDWSDPKHPDKRECDKISDVFDTGESPKAATVASDRHVGASLLTCADFGCVLWEKRE